jgi:hypothetical protein
MTSSSKTMERLRNLTAKYDDPSPPHQAEHRPSRAKPTPAPRITHLVRPQFKRGQRVFIDKLRTTGTISGVRGYDPFGGEISYDITLDASGNEVAWTEKHLTKAK